MASPKWRSKKVGGECKIGQPRGGALRILGQTTKDKQIFEQATGQQQIEIFPESETKFYLKVVEAKIEFIKEAGKVTKLILFQNGREMPGMKIE